MNIEIVAVDKLLTDPNNARQHSAKNLDAIKGSIAKFEQVEPLVVQKSSNIVIAGNGRLAAMKELGFKECRVHYVDVDNTTAAAMGIALNRTGELASWDLDSLGDVLDGLQKDEFDLGSIGFDDDDLGEFLKDSDFEAGGLTDDDEVPENVEPFCKEGQLWQLGNHRLLCGDCTVEANVERLMNGEKASISFTSPPYNVGSLNIKGDVGTERKYIQYDDNKSNDEFFVFLSSNLDILLKYSEEVFYNIGLVENNKKNIIDIMYRYKDVFKDMIYWKKNSCAPHIQSGVLNNLVEFIICLGDGRRKFINAQFKQGSYWNVIEGSNSSGNVFSKIHKATFPVYLPENILVNFSPDGGIVIDSFLGSGSTLIACEKTNRKCYGMEIDPHYCDVIIKRWEDYTGQKAELIE